MKAKSILFALCGVFALLQFFPINFSWYPAAGEEVLPVLPQASEEVFPVSAVVQSDTCDDPDANPRCCFAAMPDSLSAEMLIADPEEPGERLVITGRVFRADGKTPFAGVLLYAYHTDVRGVYSKKGGEKGIQRRHGHLHGWCRTDAEGRYTIHSIRPAQYPDAEIAAHIHEVVWAPGEREPYFINETVFADDRLVNARYREGEKRGRGGSGIVALERKANGLWVGKRDIVLD